MEYSKQSIETLNGIKELINILMTNEGETFIKRLSDLHILQ